MNKFTIILIFASFIGFHYNIVPGIKYSDLACGLLLCIVLIKFKDWRIDGFTRQTFGYLSIMAFAALMNFTFTNTVFVNYFRIFAEGLLVYYCTYNVLVSKKEIKFATILCCLYTCLHLIKAKEQMNASLAEDIATIHQTAEIYGYGRNNWGFTSVLLMFFLLFSSYTKSLNKYLICILTVGLMVCTYMSFSRFAILSSIFVLVWYRFWYGSKISVNEILIYVFGIVSYIIISTQASSLFNSGVFETGSELLASKLDNVAEDASNTRFYNLNIVPLINAWYNSKPLQLLVGDGISILHSFPAHTFLSTGIIGFVYFLSYNIKAIKNNYIGRNISCFITVLLVLMLANDFVTNARFIIQLNTLLFMFLLAYIKKYSQL